MKIRVRDTRSLSPVAQEELRVRAVAAVKAGMTQAEAARVFGVTSKTVWRWMDTYARKGNRGLVAGKRGRRPGEQKALTVVQQKSLKRSIVGRYPSQLSLPGMVWTRDQVRGLVLMRFGINLSGKTIGKYLRSWGLSPQKPIRKAYEQDPVAVVLWLKETYPAIVKAARADGGVIFWLDQTGLRSDAAVGTTWAPVAKTPVVGKTGKRFGVNAMAAISNKGELYFTVYTGSFNGPLFLAFLKRLVAQLGRKIHLIVDGHPVHRRKTIKNWVAAHHQEIEMHFLPGYSPELNPTELLNADLKHHVSKTNPANQHELSGEVRTHLHRRQNQPHIVKALFGKAEVRYAAA